MARRPSLDPRVRWRTSDRVRAVRLLAETSRGWTGALGVFVLASTVLPVLVLASMGQVVGRVPAAARDGLGSSAGTALLVALGVSAASYGAGLVLGPIQGALSSAIKTRLTFAMQERLIAAVSGPTGIAHLEDAAVLNQLEMARGQLSNYYPADAPVTLAVVTGTRLSGLLACAVIGYYRWWLGIGMLAGWLAIRHPLRRIIEEQAQAFGASAGLMRRGHYLQQLASRAPAAKESRVFGFGEWVTARFREQWVLGMAASWKMLRRYNVGVTRLGVVVLAGYAGSVGAVAYSAHHHHLTLTALSTLLPMLVASSSVGDISWEDVALAWQLMSIPNLGALEDDLTAPAALPRPAAGAGLEAGAPEREVRFEQVGFRYPGAERPVLSSLDLTLEAGRSTAIVGLNGAGKTTLVKLLCRLHDPTSGRLLVDGHDVAGIDAATWQRRVAVVFQDFVQYPCSASDNIGFGAVEHLGDRRLIAEAAGRSGADEIIEGLGSGWDTPLSRRYTGGTDLSGGQWQRVALARALMAASCGARILVLDEPTAWLDVRGEVEFFSRFLDLTAGLTTLVISHRFSTVRRADRIVVLEGGRVAESGDHHSLLAAGGRYAAMFRDQAAHFEEGAA